MTRLLSFHHKPAIASQAGFAIGTLFLCALALFMCASHTRKWRRWRAHYNYRNRDPVIQLNNEGMMTQGFRFENGDASTYSGGVGEEVSVWQKNIIMGGKCQLPDYSGVIIYDSAGNVVPPKKAPLALPWK